MDIKKIRCALIGWGRIAANHWIAIEAHAERLELVAVCDLDLAARERARAVTGVPVFADLLDMLQSVKPDLVLVLTPSGLHASHAMAAAQLGCHVMVEKPMATQWQDAKDMVVACEANHVKLFVVKQNRLNPTLTALKQAIIADRFGKIYMVTANVFWHRPQAYYDSASWRGTRALDGGAFLNQACHYIDIMQWLAGNVSEVVCLKDTLARRIEMEDTGSVTMRFASGAIGAINATMLTYPKNLEGSITVLGENGTVRVGGVALNQIEHWVFSEQRATDHATLANASYQPSSVYGSGHTDYYANVLDCLQGRALPIADGCEGMKSLATILAAYDSAQSGAVVRMPGRFVL